jgi:hypothetical protein
MPGSLFLELATDLKVHAGHHDIEQDQIGRLLRCYFQRQRPLLAIFIAQSAPNIPRSTSMFLEYRPRPAGYFFQFCSYLYSMTRRCTSASAFRNRNRLYTGSVVQTSSGCRVLIGG